MESIIESHHKALMSKLYSTIESLHEHTLRFNHVTSIESYWKPRCLYDLKRRGFPDASMSQIESWIRKNVKVSHRRIIDDYNGTVGYRTNYSQSWNIAKKNSLTQEKNYLKHYISKYGAENVLYQKCLKYTDDDGVSHWVRPDILIILDSEVYIREIKPNDTYKSNRQKQAHLKAVIQNFPNHSRYYHKYIYKDSDLQGDEEEMAIGWMTEDGDVEYIIDD
jgi:hypothetical protein